MKCLVRVGWIVVLALLVQSVGCKKQRLSDRVAEAVVVGDSMAPTLLGSHQCQVCSDCGLEIVSEVVEPGRRVLVCPNCGSRVAVESADRTEPADEVILNVGQLPERFQVVGFQRSGDRQASIKRVIGLPGEKVWFENGNVFLQTQNGKATLLKKDWSQQKLTRLLVHDNRFTNQDPRWLPLEPGSPLKDAVPKRFQTEEFHWLRYQPTRCYEHTAGQPWTPRIEDTYGFNQGLSRQLNPVNEVCVDFDFDSVAKSIEAGQVECLIGIVVGEQTHLVRFVLKRGSMEVQLFGREEELTKVTRCQIDRDVPVCGISNFDQQILVAVGGKQVGSIDLAEQELGAPVEVLLSLRPSNTADLKGLRLWRDAYYFSQVSAEELLRRQASSEGGGDEGYFVVGDNLPVSQDSRFWLRPRVEAQEILGVVDIGQ